MAQKSKTQRAKASARRAERKAQAKVDEVQEAVEQAEEPAKDEKRGLLKSKASAPAETKPAKKDDKPAKKPKKNGFFANVRSEMKRVTWPSRQDVLQWSGVVVVALIFFSVYVFVLDNWIVTPLLLLISGIGA